RSRDITEPLPRELDILDRFPVEISSAGIVVTPRRVLYTTPKRVARAYARSLYLSFNQPEAYGALRWKLQIDKTAPREYTIRTLTTSPASGSFGDSSTFASWYPIADTLDPVDFGIPLESDTSLALEFAETSNFSVFLPWVITAIARLRIMEIA
ncbi:MAG: hypothetical protein ACE5HD_13105, partial [Acidobacteriota bacterium]